VYYSVRHVTRFTYERSVTESVTEARMQPLSDALQRCLHFGLRTAPASRVMFYLDHQGNAVHHFDIPVRHTQLTITAEALVECDAPPPLPDALPSESWVSLDAMAAAGECWDALASSTFARQTPLLDEFAAAIGLDRTDDPLTTMRRVMAAVASRFQYSPQSTRVDSPIDDALAARRGVCQDFTHIFIALGRRLGVPCRYVSGYLFQEATDTPLAAAATHAWAEAFMPGIGWVGFDPTNNAVAGEGHIRIAIGRDYADVPPTRGVFKGGSTVRSELAVAVKVVSTRPAETREVVPFVPWMSRDAASPLTTDIAEQEQQAQQQ
jgi:transglutaminase-like putative cysteine protease